MKTKELPKLTDPEFEIMKIIWELGEASVNQVLDAFNEGREKEVKRSTIQVQMERLEEKGWLEHHDEGRTFLYCATRDREKTTLDIVRDVNERLFNGSAAELVRTLLGSSKIKPDDIKRLRAILDKHGSRPEK